MTRQLPVPLPAVAAVLGVAGAGAFSGPRLQRSEQGPATAANPCLHSDGAASAANCTAACGGVSADPAAAPTGWLHGLLTSHRRAGGAAAASPGAASTAPTASAASGWGSRLQLPLQLLTPALADEDSSSPGSSAAAATASASSSNAAAAAGGKGGKGLVQLLLPLGGDDLGSSEGEPDTITGVFHRLDPAAAKLVLVQVVFRHGARTPLSDRAELWEGVAWDVCGEAYKAAGVRLFSTSGVENPLSRHDKRQRSVAYPGGCRKGELTLLGQAQARDLGAWLRQRYVLGGAGAGGQTGEDEEAEAEQQAGAGGSAHGEGFLPPHYQEGLLSARTTNISRTIATLRGVLTGLYPELPTRPPQHDFVEQLQQQRQEQQAASATAAGGSSSAQQQKQEREHDKLPYVTTSSDLDEILYADTRACPHLQSFRAVQREQGKAAIQADPDYAWARDTLLAVLPQLRGVDAATFDSQPWIFTDIHDVLTSLAAHGKPLPLRLEALGPGGWEQLPRLLAAVDRLATLEFATEVAPSVRDRFGRAVMRLSMGRLLHTLVGNMTSAAAAAAAAAAGGASKEPQAGSSNSSSAAAPPPPGSPSPRMYLYSGHDSTIMPLLSALGLDVTHWPPYLSNIVIELWQLPPPPQTSATAAQQDAATAATAAAAPPPQSPPPRFVVRVLFNREELALPHCPQGYLPSLSTFSREVVGPFLLSAADQPSVCAVKMGHDTSLPQLKAKAAAAAAAPAPAAQGQASAAPASK